MTTLPDSPVSVRLELRTFATDLLLPAGTEILRAREPEAIGDVRAAVLEALDAPIGTAPLGELCHDVLARKAPAGGAAMGAAAGVATGAARDKSPSVVVVVSDNTRPVPYRGEGGMLWPLVEFLLSAGFSPESITLLVATGTHRLLSEEEIWALLDERARKSGIRVLCHDATDRDSLAHVGRSARGTDVFVNRAYVDADFRILTGLVEPHLMAGASGGRKSICPGLLNVESVRDFHGPPTIADDRAADLVLDGNPCHELSLEIARMVRPDFILNVTMRQDGRIAGVFAGDMEAAHLFAVDHVRSFAQITLEREYDVVLAHGGLVGVNHYQGEKAAAEAGRAARDGGYVVVIADTTEPDPLGTESYRYLMALLADLGPEAFLRAIKADDWQFAHDQWGAQVWAQMLLKVPRDHMFYFSPQTAAADYAILPCVDPRDLAADLTGAGAAAPGNPDVGGPGERVAQFVSAALAHACQESEAATGRRATVAYLADGPHGIPVGPNTPGV